LHIEKYLHVQKVVPHVQFNGRICKMHSVYEKPYLD